MSGSSKAFPAIYSFPPLYTRQPNALIRRQQISSWIELILEFCKSQNYWCMTAEGIPVTENNESKDSIFTNADIQRSVPQVFVEEIWLRMCDEGKALGVEGGRRDSSQFYLLWRNFDSWASLILQWFENSGKLNQVVTIYELTDGDETVDWEFHGMPQTLMAFCIKPLCQRNRATLINDERGKPVATKVV